MQPKISENDALELGELEMLNAEDTINQTLQQKLEFNNRLRPKIYHSVQDSYVGTTNKPTIYDVMEEMEGNGDPLQHNASNLQGNNKYFSKQITKLRGVELFKQHCHFSLAQHRLASIHLGTMQFFCFTVPLAAIAMCSGVLAFLATSGLVNDHGQTILNCTVGVLSFLLVYFQTLSGALKYDSRSDMHENTANDLQELRGSLENIVNRSRVMIGYREDTKSTQSSKDEDDQDKTGDDDDDAHSNNNNNNNSTSDTQHEQSLEVLFDGIQKQYNQCLKGCRSSVPYPIHDAFALLDSRINATMSKMGHRELRRIYGSDYNNVIYFQACDDLLLRFSCRIFWPLLLPNPRKAVHDTMKNLKITISTDGMEYWDVLKKDAKEEETNCTETTKGGQ